MRALWLGCGVLAVIGSIAVAVKWTALHPVSWWQVHPQERAQTVGWCRDWPGVASYMPNCSAAEEADWQAKIDAVLAASRR